MTDAGEGVLNADILEDLLRPGLRVVFCGTQAGRVSALKRAYYAGPGNKFWLILHEVGLTSERLVAHDWRRLSELGIGLTDVAKATSGPDSALRAGHLGAAALIARLTAAAPKLVAFNGKRAASAALREAGRDLDYGMQTVRIGDIPVFVLPSTSGAASAFWNARPWHDLASMVQR